MLFRNAPLSNDVSRPAISTIEIGPACRMVAEKFKFYPRKFQAVILPAAVEDE